MGKNVPESYILVPGEVLCRMCDVPETGWEVRVGHGYSWRPIQEWGARGTDRNRLCIARRKRADQDHGIQLTYTHGPGCRGCIRVRENAFDAIAGTRVRSGDENEL